MITENQRIEIKKVIGTRYTKDVQGILKNAGVRKPNGEEYKISFITHVFNGLYENADIEKAILDLYYLRLEAKEALNHRLQEIEKKKPAATTTGS